MNQETDHRKTLTMVAEISWQIPDNSTYNEDQSLNHWRKYGTKVSGHHPSPFRAVLTQTLHFRRSAKQSHRRDATTIVAPFQAVQ